jgi:EpsI family protein
MVGAAAADPDAEAVPRARRSNSSARFPRASANGALDPETEPVAPTADVKAKLDLIYSQIVSRTYVNGAGERMMLTVAYGGDQSDALKAHRQEACYAAQGFDIHGLARGSTSLAGRTIPVTRMVAVRGERVEPVTYWFTMGDRVVLGRGERLGVQVAAGLKGRIPDGMLVRVSSLSEDAPHAFAAQQAFLAAIFAPMPDAQVARFVGRTGS